MPKISDRLQMLDVAVNGTTRERDMLSSNFAQGFRVKRGVKWHTVTQDEVGRPDLIAFREYGSTALWWVIMKVSGIINPFELTSGTPVMIPSLLDFNDYYDRYHK